MKKILVIMLVVFGISVSGFAKGNTFTKGNTEPRLSNEKSLYLGLITQLERESARMDRAAYIAYTALLAKYEEYFLELRGLGDGYFLANLNEDDLAYIYTVLNNFVMEQYHRLNPGISNFTEEEMTGYNNFYDQLDVCKIANIVDKKFVGCK